jgi:hypothetical protein
MYIAMGKVDDATAVLGPLASSANPEVAARARESIEQIKKMRVVLQAAQNPEHGLMASPGLHTERPANVEVAEKEEVHQLPTATPPKFLKGQLLSIDCSHTPTAVLTVLSGARTLKMKVADTQHAIVIGAGEFSCEWTKKKVAVNYRESSDGELSVMTVEIQ